jgi:hypothetical protein
MNGINAVSMGSFWRAVRGPVMLITLGTLMAMDQNGVAGFGKTWPALLIVFGIFKLLERQSPPPVVSAPYPGAFPPPAAPGSSFNPPPPPQS